MTAWRFLFISLTVHLLVWFFLLNRPPIKFPSQDKVEVTILDKKTPTRITRSVQLPKEMLKNEPAKNPKYSSDRDQSVKKEMRAKALGITQNQLQPGNHGKPSAPKSQKQDVGETKHDLSRFTPTFDADKSVTPPSRPGGVSTSEDDREVAEGPITALNSERFIYASFFNRIEDRMRPPWTRNLETAHDRLTPKRQKDMINHEWVTVVDVILDPQGHYITTDILQSCGITEIDNAGVQAFREANFFPNPPKELVQADHKIHLHFALRFLVSDNGFGPWSRPF